MQIPKSFFHDRVVLLFISLNTFLALIGSLLIFLRLDGGRSTTYIIQFRSNLGLSAYRSGSMMAFIGFVLFFVFVLVFHTLLSARLYTHRRQYAFIMLGMGFLLLVLGIVVSNALLVLR